MRNEQNNGNPELRVESFVPLTPPENIFGSIFNFFKNFGTNAYEGTNALFSKDKLFYPNGDNLMYVGQMDKTTKKKHGKGTYFYESGKKMYTGDYNQDLKEGFGTLFYENGATMYVGKFNDDKKEGKGRSFNRNKVLEYDGDFSNNLKHGEGVLYDTQGNLKYKGAFIENEKSGFGEYYHYNKKVSYKGCWLKDKKNGFGEKYNINGFMEYEGDYKNDKQTGTGMVFTEKYEGGLMYSGEVKNNSLFGVGKWYIKHQDKGSKTNFLREELCLKDAKEKCYIDSKVFAYRKDIDARLKKHNIIPWQDYPVFEGEWKNNTELKKVLHQFISIYSDLVKPEELYKDLPEKEKIFEGNSSNRIAISNYYGGCIEKNGQNIPHGWGVLIFPQSFSIIHEGMWCYGKKNGDGKDFILKSNIGSMVSYIGGYKEDKRNGWGTTYDVKQETGKKEFVGKFSNNFCDVKFGITYLRDGSISRVFNRLQ